LRDLASAKGFKLTESDDEDSLTLDYLKQFQVIVWNNNTDGAASVPSSRARQAVIDYLTQGGSWLLIHGAAMVSVTWPELTQALGTTFHRFGQGGEAEVVLDEDARRHKELKWMVEGFPDAFRLNDLWYSFTNTVRPLEGVTIIATSRAVPDRYNVFVPTADRSGDQPYIWAREIGEGRLLYNAIGFGQNQLMTQQDSIVPRLYWQNLRYLAGDFRNGCTDAGSPRFDPEARVHIDSACATIGARSVPGFTGPGLHMMRGGMKASLAFTPSGPFTVRLRDVRGALVWERDMPSGTMEVVLDGRIEAGVYHLEIRDGRDKMHGRLVL
jgi:hypothetical protein